MRENTLIDAATAMNNFFLSSAFKCQLKQHVITAIDLGALIHMALLGNLMVLKSTIY